MEIIHKMKISKTKLVANYKTIMILLFFTFIYGCKKQEFKEYRTFYRAVNGRDTAILSIGTHNKRFFGQYQIYYGSRAIKDSGNVDGTISGDTLRGKYKYRTYGGDINIVPIIFLKHDKKLVLGSGVAASFMHLVYYMPEYPIEFHNSKFVFNTVDKSEIK